MTEHMTTFDLISDLHLTSLNNFSWEDKATSSFCIVAGNISSERCILYEFLDELKDYYELVFFIDGNIEHECYNGNLEASYRNLIEGIELIERVVFMHENIVILNDTTLIGTNGWTTFDFTNTSTVTETIELLTKNETLSEEYANDVFKLAVTDQHYLYNSIDTCQTLDDAQNVILVTNSVPKLDFISHNNDYNGTVLGDMTGNNGITSCLEKDVYGKVGTWIFGKFPEDLDYNINGIRYVNNPGIDRDMSIYFPKRIEV